MAEHEATVRAEALYAKCKQQFGVHPETLSVAASNSATAACGMAGQPSSKLGRLSWRPLSFRKSSVGTFETCRRALNLSAYRGGPECAGRPARSRWCKSITMKE